MVDYELGQIKIEDDVKVSHKLAKAITKCSINESVEKNHEKNSRIKEITKRGSSGEEYFRETRTKFGESSGTPE